MLHPPRMLELPWTLYGRQAQPVATSFKQTALAACPQGNLSTDAMRSTADSPLRFDQGPLFCGRPFPP
jgi:hypothetical protein